MHDYEVTYILRPGLEEAEADERINAIGAIVQNAGGELGTVEKLGKKRLAYEIGDARDGYYVAMRFHSGPPVAKELERQLKLHEDVVRELLVALDKRELAHVTSVPAAEPEIPEE
jgi:small subunit ribosomal protein S6